jgi:hypothetical protein
MQNDIGDSINGFVRIMSVGDVDVGWKLLLTEWEDGYRENASRMTVRRGGTWLPVTAAGERGE